MRIDSRIPKIDESDTRLLDTGGSGSGIERKEAIEEARGIGDEATRTASS